MPEKKLQKQFDKKKNPLQEISLKKCFNQKNNFAEKKCCQKKLLKKFHKKILHLKKEFAKKKKFPLKKTFDKRQIFTMWEHCLPKLDR